MTRGRLAILHIGGEKTGSTTLQATLAINRAALAAQGVLYSRVAGSENHTLLALHATEGANTADLRAGAGLEEADAFRDFLETFPDRLREEAEASGARTLIYSNEHLSSRVRSEDGVRRLWSLLGPLAEEIRIVYYARPQEELVVSGFSTMLKSGATEPFDLERVLRWGTPPDHLAVVERWGALFDDPYWILRPYQAAAMAGGDIVEDFAAATGLSPELLRRRVGRRNRSLDAATAEFLRLYNLAMRESGEPGPGPAHGRLVRLLEELSDGPPLRLSPEQAEAVLARFAEGNATVARRLLGREELFLPHPPGPASPPGLDAAAAVRIAGAMWRATHPVERRPG